MSDQLVSTAYDAGKRTLGELVVGIRVDAVPAGEAERLAAAGQFYPLTVDARGFLRVTLPEGTTVATGELEVWREILAVLKDIRASLLKIE